MCHFAQHAVDAEADPVELFVRLKVQVGRAFLDAVEQQLLQEAHDRRILNLDAGVAAAPLLALLIVFALGQQVGHGHVVAHQLVERLGDRLGVRLHQPHQLVVFDYNHIERELGLELDLIERLEIGRIGNRNREPIAALAQGHHAQAPHQLAVDHILGQLVRIERRDIEQRMAKGIGGKTRNLRCAEAGGLRRID